MFSYSRFIFIMTIYKYRSRIAPAVKKITIMIKKAVLNLIWYTNLCIFFLWFCIGVYRRILCNLFYFFNDFLAPEDLVLKCDLGAILIILIHATGSFLTSIISIICYMMNYSHRKLCFAIMIISLIATATKYFFPANPYTI